MHSGPCCDAVGPYACASKGSPKIRSGEAAGLLRGSQHTALGCIIFTDQGYGATWNCMEKNGNRIMEKDGNDLRRDGKEGGGLASLFVLSHVLYDVFPLD